MLQVNYVRFCCFLLSAVNICLSTNSIGEESVLVSNLLKGYNKHVKPTRQKTTAVNVSVTFSLSQIIDIDERDEQMTTTGFLVCMWHDELLRWNPADYNGAFRVVLPGDQIWLPEIAVYNTVAGGNEFALDSKFRVSVFSDGTVLWVPSMTWQTSCDMDLRRFPFDTQYCSVYIMNWVYGAAGVNYVVTNGNKVALNAYQNSSEWELVDTSVFINSTDFNGMILPMMSFQLTLKRVPGYWVATIMFPSIILVVMSMLMFVMPVASQEKVSIGITALLSFFFIILMLADVCPRSSTENLPLLLFFIIITMGFSCLSIMLTMIVMNLQLQPRDTGVPRWVKALFLQKVARSLGVRPDGHISRPASVAPDKGHSNKVAPLPYGTGTVKSSVPPTGHERTFEEIPMGEKVKQHLGREAGGGRNEIEELCEFLTVKAQRKELQRMMTEEWAMLAAVVDRILCILFAIAIAITIVAVLVSILT